MPGPTGPPGWALERELKLDVPEGFVVPDLSTVVGLTVGDIVPDDHVDAYYDTPDLRLIRSGVTLRHRQSGGGGEWTVKLPRPELGAAAGLSRLEINRPGRPGRVPAVVARLVRARARTAPLRRAARLSNRRQTTVLVDGAGEPMVRIDDDTVDAATHAGRRSRFREIEVELLPAAPAPLLDAITPALEAAGARASDQTPKLARALGPAASAPPELTGDTPPARLVRELVELDPAVRLDPGSAAVERFAAVIRQLAEEPVWGDDVRLELTRLAARADRDAGRLAKALDGRGYAELLDRLVEEAR